MSSTVHRSLLAPFALAALVSAQTPVDPPPSWNVVDDDTVSVFWDFNVQATFTTPTTQVAPPWFVQPPGGGFTLGGNVGWIANVSGHNGVVGITAGATAISDTMALLVDNDPRPFWWKIFYTQFDSFAGGGSAVAAAIRKDLAKYERANISEETVPIGGGWERTTINASLIPQPVDETVDFSMTAQALQTVAIDNLFVHSKCVKPPPDETGDALGDVDGTQPNIDLNTATGDADCAAVAITEDLNSPAGTPILNYWVASRTGGAQRVSRLQGGAVNAVVPLPAAPTAPLGATDLAVARFTQAGIVRQFVFGVVDRRPGGGGVVLTAIDADASLPAIVPARSIAVNGYNGAIGDLGLCFMPSGNGGAGTFWITDAAGTATEVDLAGNLLRILTVANGLPTGIRGAAYDEARDLFYWFSDTPVATPGGGLLRANGYVHSAVDFRPTGIRFFGDLSIPNPAGPRGGLARGLEITRLRNSRFMMTCVQASGGRNLLRVLNGPYQFGWSLSGRCGMAGDPPISGASNFQVTLRGVPRASLAMLILGFDNTTQQTLALPLRLGSFGLDENVLSVSADVMTTFVGPTAPGGFAVPVPLPANLNLSGTPLFFQWLTLDSSVPRGLALTQACKTIVY